MEDERRIIDAWMQHPSPGFSQHPMFDSLRRWTRGETLNSDISLETTIATMDEAGVRIGLISAWWGPQGPLIKNDDVAGFVQAYPDRLVGIASVNLHRPMDAVRELRRCVSDLGFRGMRIVPWLWDLPPDDRRYYPYVYIDTSAYKSSRYPRDLIDYLRGHGRKKVLFGSNYPMLMPGECLRDLTGLELDDETKRMFLYENAERVFSLM